MTRSCRSSGREQFIKLFPVLNGHHLDWCCVRTKNAVENSFGTTNYSYANFLPFEGASSRWRVVDHKLTVDKLGGSMPMSSVKMGRLNLQYTNPNPNTHILPLKAV